MSAPALTAVIVMGVSGSGKSTVAAWLAGRLGWEFRDADDFHPAANIAKMRASQPLTDADRAPWLAAIAAYIARLRAENRRGVVTCSALKRAYRRVLIGDDRDVALVFLRGSEQVIGSRLAARFGHFMPPGLLASQFAALEPPDADENPVIVSIDAPPEEVGEAVFAALGARV